MKLLIVLESVNPVFRRRRLAKVMATARNHWKQQANWEKISDKLDAKGRKISKPYYKAHGPDFMKWPDAARKAHSDEHNKHDARRSNAADQVFHNLQRGRKAYHIAKGRKEKPDGSHEYRPVLSNPLRKNRDETRGKHKITPSKAQEMRAFYKRQKTEGLVKSINKFIKVSR